LPRRSWTERTFKPMRLAYGNRAAIIFVIVALLSVIFWGAVIYWLSKPVVHSEDVLMAQARDYINASDKGLTFDHRALEYLEAVVKQHPRSRQAQIALMEKARFEVRHGMLRDARQDYERIQMLWPGFRVSINAQIEEAFLLEEKFANPDGAASIREVLFSRLLIGPDSYNSDSLGLSLIRRQEILLSVGADLVNYYCEKQMWARAAETLQRLLEHMPNIQLWDQLSVRLAQLLHRNIGNSAAAVALYRKVAQAPVSPWANFAIKQLSDMEETP